MVFLALAEGAIQLIPDGSIFIHIGLILLMLFILNRTFFKPINRILEDRERKTSGKSEAHQILKAVDEKLSQYERALRDARAEGYQLLEQERSRAISERQSRLAALRQEVSTSVEEQRRAINAQVEESRAKLKDDAQRIASQIGEHILGRAVSAR
jgi:F0F1-type ATP synthase membrane subunit b/b'